MLMAAWMAAGEAGEAGEAAWSSNRSLFNRFITVLWRLKSIRAITMWETSRRCGQGSMNGKAPFKSIFRPATTRSRPGRMTRAISRNFTVTITPGTMLSWLKSQPTRTPRAPTWNWRMGLCCLGIPPMMRKMVSIFHWERPRPEPCREPLQMPAMTLTTQTIQDPPRSAGRISSSTIRTMSTPGMGAGI